MQRQHKIASFYTKSDKPILSVFEGDRLLLKEKQLLGTQVQRLEKAAWKHCRGAVSVFEARFMQAFTNTMGGKRPRIRLGGKLTGLEGK